MKAPNKIYIQDYNIPEYGLSNLYSVERVENDAVHSIEYIRKDALMEWAKEQEKHFGRRSDEVEITDPTNPDHVFFDGKRNAFHELITKLSEI